MRRTDEEAYAHLAALLPERLATVELSASETQALTLASHGLEGTEAAEASGRTLNSIRDSLKDARRKLAGKNTTHAVAIAVRARLIP